MKVRALLCISPDKRVVGSIGSPGGTPDAWIYDLKGSVVVAIESKIKGGVTESQINGHIKSLGWKLSNTKVVHLSWEDVYNFLNNTLHQCSGVLDIKFLRQGIEYLEYVGMDRFNGFKNEDFDYFSSPNLSYKPILKRKIERFSDLLKGRIDASLKDEYKDFYIGNLGLSSKEWAWMAIKRLGDKKDQFLQCNYTVEIKSEGLEVNVVFRNGRCTDVKKPIGVLYKKIDEQVSDFRNILKRLGPDAYVELFSRESRQGGSPMSGNEVWRKVFSLELGYLTNEAIMHVQSLMREVAFPGLHIGYRFKRGSSLLSDPDKLFEQINKRFVDLKPALDFILKR